MANGGPAARYIGGVIDLFGIHDLKWRSFQLFSNCNCDIFMLGDIIEGGEN